VPVRREPHRDPTLFPKNRLSLKALRRYRLGVWPVCPMNLVSNEAGSKLSSFATRTHEGTSERVNLGAELRGSMGGCHKNNDRREKPCWASGSRARGVGLVRVLSAVVPRSPAPSSGSWFAHPLAATFDPIMLERIGAYGVVPDVSSARSWYEKTKEFGSEEAPPRLEMLARRKM
jgi:hypothetical protein